MTEFGALLESSSVHWTDVRIRKRETPCFTIMNRMAHVKAYEVGKTAREFEPRSKAAHEMEALENWITKHHG